MESGFLKVSPVVIATGDFNGGRSIIRTKYARSSVSDQIHAVEMQVGILPPTTNFSNNKNHGSAMFQHRRVHPNGRSQMNRIFPIHCEFNLRQGRMKGKVNPTVRTCPGCKGKLVKYGFLKKERTQKYRCKQCRKMCSDAASRPFGTLRSKPETILLVTELLTEGMGVRAAARVMVRWNVVEVSSMRPRSWANKPKPYLF